MGVAAGDKAQYDPHSSREVERLLSMCDWYGGWARTDGWLVVLISWALPGVCLHWGGVRMWIWVFRDNLALNKSN